MRVDYNDIPGRGLPPPPPPPKEGEKGGGGGPGGKGGGFDFEGQPKWNIPETIMIKVAVVGRPPDRKGSPTTIEEVIEQTSQCIEAGASIVHYHAQGQTVEEWVEDFHRFIDPLKARHGNDVIFDLSIATRPNFEEEKYLAEADLCELNPVNMSLGGAAQPMKLVQAEFQVEQDNGIRPEIACYEDGDIDRARAWLYDTEIVQKPGWWDLLPSYWVGSTPLYNEFAMLESMTYQIRQIKFIDPDAVIMLAGCGRPSSYMVAFAIMMGLHIKVGMEDVYYLYPHRDDIMDDNLKSVQDTVTMARILGRRPATANEVRAYAHLPLR